MLRRGINNKGYLKGHQRDIPIMDLKEVNRKHLCACTLKMTLMNKRSEGDNTCFNNRSLKASKAKKPVLDCNFINSKYEDIFTFWDCLASIEKINEMKSKLKSSEKFDDALNFSKDIIKNYIKEIYMMISGRFNHDNSDHNIVLTLGNSNSKKITFGSRGSPTLRSFEEELIASDWTVIDLIKKYYEVSHDWNNGDKSDSIKCPIYTFKETKYNKSDGPISYEHHYICRDIGRIFGHCNDHRDGNGCNYGVKCRREIHLKAYDDIGNVIYDIDHHLENFKSILLSISEEVEIEIKDTLDSNQEVNGILNEDQFQEEQSPRFNVMSPSTVDSSSINSKSSYAQVLSRNRAHSFENSVQSSRQTEVNPSLNEWVKYWFGENGDENISRLMTESGIKIQCKDDLITLIKRLYWRCRNKRDTHKLDDKLIKEKFRDYQRYKEGDNLFNINDVSIRSATSEKHLSQEFKSVDDDKRQEYNKNSRANSYRHNNYNMTESCIEAGHYVFNMGDIDNMENRYIDVMAEFLDLRVFEDPVFLIPIQTSFLDINDNQRTGKWNSENLKFLSESDKLNLESKINNGMFTMELFKDSNIRDQYKVFLKKVNRGNYKSLPCDLYGGNWLVRMGEKDFNCVIFYYVNRNNKDYEGLNLGMCLRHYSAHGHTLTSLQNPKARKLYLVGVDSLLEESLPMNFRSEDYSRSELLDIITEYYINVSMATQIRKLNPDDFEDYKKSLVSKKIPDINEGKKSDDSSLVSQVQRKKIETDREYYQVKIENDYLNLINSNSNLQQISEDVFRKTLAKINEDKKEGWSIPCVTKASKGTHMITAKTVESVIRCKLGLDHFLSFNTDNQIDKIDKSLKENQKILKSPKSSQSEINQARKLFNTLSEEKGDLVRNRNLMKRRDFEKEITDLTIKIAEKSKYITRLQIQNKIEDANKELIIKRELIDQKERIMNESDIYNRNKDISDFNSLNETLKLSGRINNPENGFKNGSDQVSENEFEYLFSGDRGKALLMK